LGQFFSLFLFEIIWKKGGLCNQILYREVWKEIGSGSEIRKKGGYSYDLYDGKKGGYGYPGVYGGKKGGYGYDLYDGKKGGYGGKKGAYGYDLYDGKKGYVYPEVYGGKNEGYGYPGVYGGKKGDYGYIQAEEAAKL
jgi:hypothetical protein